MILIKWTDKRFWKYLLQNITRGYNDSETWNLCECTIRFVLPRLKRFKELNNGYPPEITPEKYDGYLDEMIWAMEHKLRCDSVCVKRLDEDRNTMIMNGKRMQKGFELFGKYFNGLWW